MPNSWITESGPTRIRLAHPHNRAGMAASDTERSYDLLTDPRFQDADKTKVALVLKGVIQEDMTTRILLINLPDDEWTKTTDPVSVYGERMFWEGHGRNTERVSRSTIVERFEWDGQGWDHELRRAR